jgi:Na+/H+ antiporter NhaA
VLKSGVHATLAGVALALAIPFNPGPGGVSVLIRTSGASWRALYGTNILTGMGFTMSLFIGTVAFGEPDHEATMGSGVLVGSALSGIIGAIVLSLVGRGSFPRFRPGQRPRSGNSSTNPARDAEQMPRSL